MAGRKRTLLDFPYSVLAVSHPHDDVMYSHHAMSRFVRILWSSATEAPGDLDRGSILASLSDVYVT